MDKRDPWHEMQENASGEREKALSKKCRTIFGFGRRKIPGKAVQPSHLMKWVRHLIGSNKIEEHFEVIPTAELIARDWRKRNFTTWLK